MSSGREGKVKKSRSRDRRESQADVPVSESKRGGTVADMFKQMSAEGGMQELMQSMGSLGGKSWSLVRCLFALVRLIASSCGYRAVDERGYGGLESDAGFSR